MKVLYPWQQNIWQQFLWQRQHERLAHAILLSGIAGLGQSFLVQKIVGNLLCTALTINQQACGQCNACQLLSACTHPDFLVLEPEIEGQAIKVEQIRQLQTFFQQTSQRGGYRILYLSDADAMNTAAANALLKTLEEPAAKTIIILSSHFPAELPATIRSRCQQWRLCSPSFNEAISWLQPQIDEVVDLPMVLELTDGAPLAALQFISGRHYQQYQNYFQQLDNYFSKQIDPMQLAQEWCKLDLQQILKCICAWVQCRLKQANLSDLSGQKKQLFKVYADAVDALRLLRRKSPLNPQLLLESILLAQGEIC